MGSIDTTAWRSLLRHQRAELVAQVGSLTRTFDEMVAATDLEPADDEHDPDGTTAYERAQITSLAEAAEAQVREFDQALARLDDGTFGACEACGAPIAIERLEALPATRHCLRCASAVPWN